MSVGGLAELYNLGLTQITTTPRATNDLHNGSLSSMCAVTELAFKAPLSESEVRRALRSVWKLSLNLRSSEAASRLRFNDLSPKLPM